MGVSFAQRVLIFGPGLGVSTEPVVFFQKLDIVSGPQIVQSLEDFVRRAHDGVVLDSDFVSMFADFYGYAPWRVVSCQLAVISFGDDDLRSRGGGRG